MRKNWWPLRVVAAAFVIGSLCGTTRAQTPGTERGPIPAATLGCPAAQGPLQGPTFSEGKEPPQLAPGQPETTDKPLPINLATALRLADARPLIIAAAQASVQAEAARLLQTQLLWLPDIYLGGSYYRHDGEVQGTSGTSFINSKDQFMAGGGAVLLVSAADAIFAPLAERQVVQARVADVQRARNDALQEVAETYFNVQQARGRLAGVQDTLDKTHDLQKRVNSLAKGLVPVMEIDRVRALAADLEQSVALAREDWRTTSTDLTRVLRLDPTALVAPQEPPYLRVTLIAPQEPVDALVPIGLTNRPELATQQALVQAALVRLKQERLRPLIPSLVLSGDSAPASQGGFLADGVFGSTVNGHTNPTGLRNDWNVQVLWELKGLGFGNHALVRERDAQRLQALIELFKVQDMVAAEVARAFANVQSATVRLGQAETGVKEAQVTFAGNLKGISETTRFGDVLVLVTRPQEVVAALQQLARAYDLYFASVGDYNRAQFRLYRALGYPAGILACERSSGQLLPIDTTRPCQMAPVAP
jgi:outer membrane protein TolC